MEIGTVSQEFTNPFAAQSETADMKSTIRASSEIFGND